MNGRGGVDSKTPRVHPEPFDSPFVLNQEVLEGSKDERRLGTGSVKGQTAVWPKGSMNLGLFKHVFGCAAYRANPAIRELLKRSVGRHVAVRIACFRIIDVTADFAFVLFHGSPPQKYGMNSIDRYPHYFSISSSYFFSN